jgi:hypothetical protein
MSRLPMTAREVGREIVTGVADRSARQKIEDIKTGANRQTARAATATSHYAKTGQKLDPNPASLAGAAAPKAPGPAEPSQAAKDAATVAIIRSRLGGGSA